MKNFQCIESEEVETVKWLATGKFIIDWKKKKQFIQGSEMNHSRQLPIKT